MPTPQPPQGPVGGVLQTRKGTGTGDTSLREGLEWQREAEPPGRGVWASEKKERLG